MTVISVALVHLIFGIKRTVSVPIYPTKDIVNLIAEKSGYNESSIEATLNAMFENNGGIHPTSKADLVSCIISDGNYNNRVGLNRIISCIEHYHVDGVDLKKGVKEGSQGADYLKPEYDSCNFFGGSGHGSSGHDKPTTFQTSKKPGGNDCIEPEDKYFDFFKDPGILISKQDEFFKDPGILKGEHDDFY